MHFHYADRLEALSQKKESVLCVGLDPVWDRLPAFLKKKMVQEFGEGREAMAMAFLEFSKWIVDAVAPYAVAVKPQSAYFEALGSFGVQALEAICAYAKEQGLLVILDVKRGDIGSTSEAYAEAYFNSVVYCDAITVAPYMGHDSLAPFFRIAEEKGKGVYVLVKTSNPSSSDIQDRQTLEEKMSIADLVAHFVDSWGSDLVGMTEMSLVGAVVGATHPKELKKFRELMPQAPFLIPGYGAQGGKAEDLAPAFFAGRRGALVNSSRAIIYAFETLEKISEKSVTESIAQAAKTATEELNNIVYS